MSLIRDISACTTGCMCIESDLGNRCPVHAIGHGDEAAIQCLADEPCAGQCSVGFGYSMRMCICPMRKYIWKHYKK